MQRGPGAVTLVRMNLPALPDKEPSSVELWNKDDPRSVISLVSPRVAEAMIAASVARPDLFALDERSLYKKLGSEHQKISPTDNRLRVRFWDEYERAQANSQKKFRMENVYAGVCTHGYFFERYLKSNERVAWLLTPPASYVVRAEEALGFGLERMRDILELPIEGDDGKINVKLAELQAKIVAMLDIRVKGAVVQRVENKNMNLNVATSDQGVAKALVGQSMGDIEKRLKELEKRDRLAIERAQEAPDTIEAESRELSDAESEDAT